MQTTKKVYALLFLNSILITICILFFTPSAHAFDTLTPRNGVYYNVLLLNSYHTGYKWTDDVIAGVQKGFEDSGLPYKLRMDFMDTKRVNDAKFHELYLQMITYKFERESFDIVISADDDAFNFISEHRDKLFPGVPFLFCGTNFINLHPEKYEGVPNMTGVNEESSIEESLDIALKLHGDTEHIYFIHDNTTTGTMVSEYIDKLIPKYNNRYTTTVLDGTMSEEEIRTRVRTLPEHSLIYFTIFSFDKDYKFYEYDEFLKILKEETDAPIYGTWDFHLGKNGIAGGMLTSGFEQGSTVSEMAVRVLLGEAIDSIPVRLTSPNVYEFDYEQLVKYEADLTQLPPESLIINKPPSFYQQYKKFVWLGVTGVVLLVLLIIGLFIHDGFNTLKLAKTKTERTQLEQAVAQRTSELKQANGTMEREIEQRKEIEKKLKEKNTELETYNKLVTGRELKMVELKEKIKELESKLS